MNIHTVSDYSYNRPQDGIGMKKAGANCRLCLSELQDGTVTRLDGIVKDMLEIILPELNLSICHSPSICKSCLQTLKQSYSFKSCCLEAENKVQEFASPHSFVDLKKVLGKAGVQEVTNQVVCRLCLSLKIEASLTRLCSYEGDPLQNMVEKCLPEMGLNVTKDPMICSMCLEQLEEQFHFIMQCLDTEAKINFYSERKHVFSDIDLYNVCLFAVCMEEVDEIDKYVEGTESLHNCDTDDDRLMLKEEGPIEEKKCSAEVIDLTDEYLRTLSKEKKDPDSLKCEEKDHKTEIHNSVIKEDKNESDTDISVTDPSDLLEVRKIRKVRDISTYKKVSKKVTQPEPTKVEPNYKEPALEDDEPDCRDSPKKRLMLRKCKYCNFKTKFTSRMKAHMTVNHPGESKKLEGDDVKIEKTWTCWRCSFKASSKSELVLHRSQHIKETQFTCPHCSMVFHKEHFFIKHVDNHANNAEKPIKKPKKKKDSLTAPSKPIGNRFGFNGQFLKMFKCRLCPYQTRMKSNYERHQQIHRKPTEIVTHKCKECNFETIQKENYLAHMQTHELDDINKIPKCFLCSFQPKTESALKHHVNTAHKSNTEVGKKENL